MENSESQLGFKSWLADLDAWVGIVGATIDLDTAWDEDLYLAVTDGRYFLTVRDCRDQIGHNNFEFREGRSSMFCEPVFSLNLYLC